VFVVGEVELDQWRGVGVDRVLGSDEVDLLAVDPLDRDELADLKVGDVLVDGSRLLERLPNLSLGGCSKTPCMIERDVRRRAVYRGRRACDSRFT